MSPSVVTLLRDASVSDAVDELLQQWHRLLPVYGPLWQSLLRDTSAIAEHDECTDEARTEKATPSCLCCLATKSFLPAELLAPYDDDTERNESHVLNSDDYELSTVQNVDNLQVDTKNSEVLEKNKENNDRYLIDTEGDNVLKYAGFEEGYHDDGGGLNAELDNVLKQTNRNVCRRPSHEEKCGNKDGSVDRKMEHNNYENGNEVQWERKENDRLNELDTLIGNRGADFAILDKTGEESRRDNREYSMVRVNFETMTEDAASSSLKKYSEVVLDVKDYLISDIHRGFDEFNNVDGNATAQRVSDDDEAEDWNADDSKRSNCRRPFMDIACGTDRTNDDIKVHHRSELGDKDCSDREEDSAEGTSCSSGSTVVNFDHVSFDLSPRSMDGGDMWGAAEQPSSGDAGQQLHDIVPSSPVDQMQLLSLDDGSAKGCSDAEEADTILELDQSLNESFLACGSMEINLDNVGFKPLPQHIGTSVECWSSPIDNAPPVNTLSSESDLHDDLYVTALPSSKIVLPSERNMKMNTSIVVDILSSDDEDEMESLVVTLKPKCTRSTSSSRKTRPPFSLSESSSAVSHNNSVGNDSSDELEWDGQLFENLSVRDRIKNNESLNGRFRATTEIVIFSDDDDTSNNLSDEAEWIDPLLDMDRDEGCIKALIKCTSEIVIDEDDSKRKASDLSVFRGKTELEQRPRAESKASFRKSREELSQKLLKTFDRTAFDGLLGIRVASVEESLVTLTWSNKLRTTAGLTRLKRITQVPSLHHSKQQAFEQRYCRAAVIELSTKVIDDENRLRSTLLHELCHAAAWVVDGTMKPAHGSCFKKWAAKAMRAVPDVMVTTTHDYEIDYKYAWSCTNPSCTVVIKRHSRSVDVKKKVCGRCRRRLQEIQVPAMGSAGDYTPRKKAPPSAYNLFVREHSQQVRQRLQAVNGANVTQPEVMKECARLWHSQNAKKI